MKKKFLWIKQIKALITTLITKTITIAITIYFLAHIGNIFAATTEKTKFIAYSESGRGTPLILIHAFPTDQRLWDPQQALNQYFRLITFDLWGFGQSEKVDGKAVEMGDYADEIKQLMDQLHIERAIIGGESMGGYIALAFLEKYPEMIQGLILSNTQSSADSSDLKRKRRVTAADILEAGTKNFMNGFMLKALSSDADDQIKFALQRILESQATTALASALRGMALRTDTTTSLTETTLPILIITGEQDSLISPRQSEKMKELTKNSKLVIIPDAGHLSNLEQPTKWNQAVIEMFHPSEPPLSQKLKLNNLPKQVEIKKN